MGFRIKDKTIRFAFEHGYLVRTVTGASGNSYTHRCTLATFEAAAFAIEETPVDGEGTTVAAIAKQEGLPFSQCDLAIAFLYDRGIVDRHHRRNYPVGNGVYLDAMIEWHALAERDRHDLNLTSKGV